MPPKTRAAKTTKGLKENINVIDKSNVKHVGKVTKPPRKALADKTNSASDDNASIETQKKVSKKAPTVAKVTKIDVENDNTERPRRDRRLPNRFVENHVLKSLCNSKDSTLLTPVSNSDKTFTPVKSVESPFKTPQKVADTSLITARPRRICRLPSRFEDHSISPNKFIPVQPVQASTPIAQNKVRLVVKNDESVQNGELSSKHRTKTAPKEGHVKINGKTTDTQPKAALKKVQEKESKTNKTSADTNNNAKQGRTLRSNKIISQTKDKSNKKHKVSLKSSKNKILPSSSPETSLGKVSPKKKATRPRQKLTNAKKPFGKNLSFRVLEDRTEEEKEGNKDVYEFTFDPNEEPTPQKKKRKRVVRKKPSQPKTVVMKNFYDDNLSKALTALKTMVSKKPSQTIHADNPKSQEDIANYKAVDVIQPSTSDMDKIPNQTQLSIQIDDIDISMDHHDMNYSPISSPNPITAIEDPTTKELSTERPALLKDPLNLQEHISFFDDQPVASSSMNVSVRHPDASPWRVAFENLPIRWQVNSYVKPNMTPAVECSFINLSDNKKKHVYTNLVPQNSDTLPQVPDNAPNLKQPSIISFMREVAEKKANKNRRRKSPTKAYNFDDINSPAANENVNFGNKTPRTVVTPRKSTDIRPVSPVSNSSITKPSDTENIKESLKRKNDSVQCEIPAKTPRKDKENTFFGFDETEIDDQENVSPKKMDQNKLRTLRPRARVVLKEINEQTGPVRTTLPVAAKSKANLETVTKLCEEIKPATDAPLFPETSPVEVPKDVEATDVNEVLENREHNDEDSQSVHLFEDIEVVHHLKPFRKSYGKAKKVTFNQRRGSDTEDSVVPRATDSSDEDDLRDLTFEIPTVKEKRVMKKKITKKQKMTKKEEEEAEAWAAGFNSMCEDVEDFPLVVE